MLSTILKRAPKLVSSPLPISSFIALRSLSSIAPPPSRYYNRRDLDFLLNETSLIKTSAKLETPQFEPAGLDMDTIKSVLDSAEGFVKRWGGLDTEFDRNEPTYNPDANIEAGEARVRMSPKMKPMLDSYVEQGFTQLNAQVEKGGLGLPYAVTCSSSAITSSPFTSGVLGHWVLTGCAANLIDHAGSQAQKDTYVAKMNAGEWTGTMALSETQAGSSLGDITCKAVPSPNGGDEYLLTGNKMWTSGADHDMYDNIIHCLLARVPDAPAGPGGISLFIVPKRLVNKDGSLGAFNDISIDGLNHKMGCRGISNCYWSLGEKEGAVGYLVGKPNEGLKNMFNMMNAMRIHVGVSAALCGVRSLQESLYYSVERKQGRLAAARGKGDQTPIIEHADVKRMLLQQKVYAEGSMALCLWGADLEDGGAPGRKETPEEVAMLLELLTPVIKSYPSSACLEGNHWGLQVLGGYGYTRDFPLEQVYRDNRLNMIHEGTHGVQAADLLGRKVKFAKGKALQLLLSRMRETADAADAAGLSKASKDLKVAIHSLENTTKSLLGQMASSPEQLNNVMSMSHEYLNLFGAIVNGFLWVEMATASKLALDRAGPGVSESDRLFYEGKIQAMQYAMKFEVNSRIKMNIFEEVDDIISETKGEMFM